MCWKFPTVPWLIKCVWWIIIYQKLPQFEPMTEFSKFQLMVSELKAFVRRFSHNSMIKLVRSILHYLNIIHLYISCHSTFRAGDHRFLPQGMKPASSLALARSSLPSGKVTMLYRTCRRNYWKYSPIQWYIYSPGLKDVVLLLVQGRPVKQVMIESWGHDFPHIIFYFSCEWSWRLLA